MAKVSAFIALLLIPFAVGAQQTIVLRDGTQINGRIESSGDHTLTFRNERGELRTFDFDQMQSINFAQGRDFDRDRDRDNDRDRANRGEGREAAFVVLPAGTEIAVRSIADIDSIDARDARTYPAEVSRDVADAEGRIVIPRESPALLVVRDVGEHHIALDLESVTIDGRSYRVDTSDLTEHSREGLGANKRTGEFVGGGAAFGTVLGAIAGGGKGAAIGAIAGAGAGASAEILTRGDHVRVPAETLLTFRLDQPVNLNMIQ